MLEIVLIRHLIPWAGHNLFSSFFSFFDFEEDPTNRLLSTSSAYSYRTLYPTQIVWYFVRSPFPGEGERVLQADAAKRVSLKAGTKTLTTSFKGLMDLWE